VLLTGSRDTERAGDHGVVLLCQGGCSHGGRLWAGRPPPVGQQLATGQVGQPYLAEALGLPSVDPLRRLSHETRVASGRMSRTLDDPA
jgi:hypothetical protein